MNWSQTGREGFKHVKILCKFFPQNISQDTPTTLVRQTVMRQSYDVPASVTNLSRQNFGEFTMQKFRDTHTNVVQMSYKSREHANTLRLSDKKINLSDIRMSPLSYQ